MPATDYAKLKVSELKDLLSKRNLPTDGLKTALIARLTDADSSSEAKPQTASTPSGSHLPSADDFEVDWDNDDDTTTAAASTAGGPVTTTAAPTTGSAPATKSDEKPSEQAKDVPAADAKPKRKTIASLFEDSSKPATAPATTPKKDASAAAATAKKSSQSPSSPSTVSDEAAKPADAAVPAVPEEKYSANLPTTDLDIELERRKKRAERFGASNEDNEKIRLLERQKRFGAAAIAEGETKVKGLDDALPERKRRRDDGGGGGRGGKRGRFNQQNNRQQQNRRNGGGGGGGGGQRRNGAPAAGKSSVLDDPTERKKADDRAKKFGLNQE